MISFTSIGIILTAMKLMGFINWPWGLVLSPFIPMALVSLLALVWWVR